MWLAMGRIYDKARRRDVNGPVTINAADCADCDGNDGRDAGVALV